MGSLFNDADIGLLYLIKLGYILSVVLYGRETWSLTLREEHKLRVFENRVLRRIFEPKRDEETRLEKTA
jgi:hypothetical protein